MNNEQENAMYRRQTLREEFSEKIANAKTQKEMEELEEEEEFRSIDCML
jgi:hypothetical protein